MIKSNIFDNTEARNTICSRGVFSVVEYSRDLSVDDDEAMQRYYEAQMNVRKRQIVADLKDNGILVQAGALQIVMGNIETRTNVTGPGNLVKKVAGSVVTGETVIKPRVTGTGVVILEPIYKHVILQDVREWPGGLVLDDGLFLACEDTVQDSIVSRSTLSSTFLGKEGFFNLMLSGSGVVALESPVPMDELILVEMEDDVLKIDGNMAIAWSNSLKFTVERTTRTLTGSAISKEGFMNVYRGTGKVLIATVEDKRGKK